MSEGVSTGERAERDRWTLTFKDPAVESEYQATATMQAGDLRLVSWVRPLLWLVGGLIVPVATSIPAWLAYAVAALQVVINLIAFAFVGRLQAKRAQGRMTMVLNLVAASVAMVLVAASGAFDVYAAPVLMLVSVVGLVAARLRFTLSVVVAVGYVVIFLAFAQRYATDNVVLQLFFVVAASAVGVVGTYLLEDQERQLFAQRRLIASLHAQVDKLFHQYLSPAVADTLFDFAGADRAGRRGGGGIGAVHGPAGLHRVFRKDRSGRRRRPAERLL